MAVHNIGEHRARGEWNGSRLHTEESDRDVDRCTGSYAVAETNVGDGAETGSDNHEHESELWLVDTFVVFGHELHDGISAVARNEGADKTDTEERKVGEADS